MLPEQPLHKRLLNYKLWFMILEVPIPENRTGRKYLCSTAKWHCILENYDIAL